MEARLSAKLLWTRSMEVLVESNRWSGKDPSLTQRKVSGSEERLFQSARNCSPKPPAERSLFQKVRPSRELQSHLLTDIR